MLVLMIIDGNHYEPLYGKHESGQRPGTQVIREGIGNGQNCMSYLESSEILTRHAISNDPVDTRGEFRETN